MPTSPGSIRSTTRSVATFAAGAVLAITAMAMSGGTPGAGATTSSGERAVYTPITPCRLMDTRPSSQVGTRGTPFGTADDVRLAARGANGSCTDTDLPDDALGLVLNVTAVGATLPTFLAVYPDGDVPNTSSLNPVPGAPPTPNAVTVKLADDGSFRIFNLQGQVDVIVDVAGYFTDHDHDDRYDTSAEVDTKITDATADFDTSAEVDAKILAESDSLFNTINGSQGPTKVNSRNIQANTNEIEQERRIQINRFDFHPVQTDNGGRRVATGAYVPSSTSNNQLWAAVTIPTGATVTGVSARVVDETTAANLEVRFYQVAPSGVRQEFAATMTSTGTNPGVRTLTGAASFSNSLVTDPFVTYEVRAQMVGGSGSWGTYAEDLQIVAFYVDYEFEVEPVL